MREQQGFPLGDRRGTNSGIRNPLAAPLTSGASRRRRVYNLCAVTARTAPPSRWSVP